MSKFYGAIGYAVTEEIRPGVWGEKITVRDYYGDVIRNTRQYQSSDNLNDNLNVSNVEVQYPRLILTVGGVYNEQTTETA